MDGDYISGDIPQSADDATEEIKKQCRDADKQAASLLLLCVEDDLLPIGPDPAGKTSKQCRILVRYQNNSIKVRGYIQSNLTPEISKDHHMTCTRYSTLSDYKPNSTAIRASRFRSTHPNSNRLKPNPSAGVNVVNRGVGYGYPTHFVLSTKDLQTIDVLRLHGLLFASSGQHSSSFRLDP